MGSEVGRRDISGRMAMPGPIGGGYPACGHQTSFPLINRLPSSRLKSRDTKTASQASRVWTERAYLSQPRRAFAVPTCFQHNASPARDSRAAWPGRRDRRSPSAGRRLLRAARRRTRPRSGRRSDCRRGGPAQAGQPTRPPAAPPPRDSLSAAPGRRRRAPPVPRKGPGDRPIQRRPPRRSSQSARVFAGEDGRPPNGRRRAPTILPRPRLTVGLDESFLGVESLDDRD